MFVKRFEVKVKNVLVVVAHPDDEVLGCGGTIAKHVKNGDNVYVVILAEGITSRGVRPDKNFRMKGLEELKEAAYKANDILGVTKLILKSFPDNRLDSVDRLDLIKEVEDLISNFKPAIIYTHHSGDVNIDHRRIHEAVVTACRPVPGCCVKHLLFFEVASSTEWQPPQSSLQFMPNWFVDISETLNKKLNALQVYSCEMRGFPHARSIDALKYLAMWRGASVGVNAAEAFMLGRNVE